MENTLATPSDSLMHYGIHYTRSNSPWESTGYDRYLNQEMLRELQEIKAEKRLTLLVLLEALPQKVTDLNREQFIEALVKVVDICNLELVHSSEVRMVYQNDIARFIFVYSRENKKIRYISIKHAKSNFKIFLFPQGFVTGMENKTDRSYQNMHFSSQVGYNLTVLQLRNIASQAC